MKHPKVKMTALANPLRRRKKKAWKRKRKKKISSRASTLAGPESFLWGSCGRAVGINRRHHGRVVGDERINPTNHLPSFLPPPEQLVSVHLWGGSSELWGWWWTFTHW
jgi:hypothetical protein